MGDAVLGITKLSSNGTLLGASFLAAYPSLTLAGLAVEAWSNTCIGLSPR